MADTKQWTALPEKWRVESRRPKGAIAITKKRHIGNFALKSIFDGSVEHFENDSKF